MAKQTEKKYTLRPGLDKNPVRVRINGEWVGIGGAIEGNGRKWREATPKEYLELAKTNPYLVKLEEK